MTYRFDCKRFNGYKPCHPGWTCDTCNGYESSGFRILIINLDALGDVLMTTALLPELKRRYPESTIWWLTSPAATSILAHNPFIDEIIPYSLESVSYLPHLTFDLVLSCDRDRKSTALAMSAHASDKRGFGLGPEGVIIPLNDEFEYAYRLGLDDELKFHINRKTGQQILAEGFGLTYRRHEYVLILTEEERRYALTYRRDTGAGDESTVVLGINTGCSSLFPYKKLHPDQLSRIISGLLRIPGAEHLRIFLLGGRQETELNRFLAEKAGDTRVICTPTEEGIRKGLLYIEACDAVLTGDTFGMHAAIALKKQTIVFFTISCDSEIDLYDRGEKITADVPCRPCWKRQCPDPICIRAIDPAHVVTVTRRVLTSLAPDIFG